MLWRSGQDAELQILRTPVTNHPLNLSDHFALTNINQRVQLSKFDR